jgi:ribonuclease HI
MDDLRSITGALIRDSKGNFVAASNKLEFVHDVLLAEIQALKHGLILAQSMGCNRIICCSDNMDVIQAMIDGGFSNGVTVPIVDDCYHLASEFVKNEFEHNCCEANAVAHELARLAHDQEHHVWLIMLG